MSYGLRVAFLLVFIIFLAPAEALSADIARQKDSPSKKVGLYEAVEIAFKHHPRLKATAAGSRAAAAGFKGAKAGYLPGIRLSEKVVRSNNPVFVFGSLLEQARFGPANFDTAFLNDPDPMTNFRSEASVHWTFFDQMQTPARVAGARAGLEKSILADLMAKQQVRLGVIQSFYGIIVAEMKVRVAQDAYQSAKKQVSRIQDLFEHGQVVRSDLLSAEVQLAEFKQQLIDAKGGLNTAHAAFLTALGNPAYVAPEIEGELLERAFPEKPLEEMIPTAFESRPDLEMMRRNLDAKRAELRGAKGAYLPRLDAFSTYGASGDDLLNGDSDFLIGISATWDLFRPDRGPALKRARAEIEMAEALFKEAENRVRLAVVQAYEAFSSAKEKLSVAGAAVEQAEEALRIVRDRYQEGLTIITEVLRAETAHLQARLRAIAARYEYITGYANLLFQAGVLDDVEEFVALKNAEQKM